MSANIHNLVDKILYSVRSSNLNYTCQETPYSVYLTIRKSWRKHQGVQQLDEPPQQLPQSLYMEVNDLRGELDDLKVRLQTSKHAEDELKAQVDVAVGELNGYKEETEKVIVRKNDEIENLKNSIKASKVDKENVCRELKDLKKIITTKEKEIYKLETSETNHLDSINNAKSENKKLKHQIKILEKNNSDMNEKELLHEKNNNKKLLLGKHNSDQIMPSLESISSSPASIASSAKTIQPEKPAVYICKHQPQCTLRQPKPPPAEKCSILVHRGSKYHEHFLTSVPARYGPHDGCMAVEYENYGCSDCIWFKKWGQLHGYPDLWPLKYIKSGTYSDQKFTDN